MSDFAAPVSGRVHLLLGCLTFRTMIPAMIYIFSKIRKRTTGKMDTMRSRAVFLRANGKVIQSSTVAMLPYWFVVSDHLLHDFLFLGLPNGLRNPRVRERKTTIYSPIPTPTVTLHTSGSRFVRWRKQYMENT